MPVAGYVLVGGKSSRFGRDKALLEFDGVPLAVRIAGRMRPVVEGVTLVGSPEKYRALGLRVIPDAVTDFGPLGGMLAALEDSASEWNLLAACDMPELTTQFFSFLAARTAGCEDDVILPYDADGRPEPLCGVYRSTARVVVRRQVEAGVHKVMHALDGLRIARLDPKDWAALDPAGRLFTNLNRPQDWEGKWGRV
ncbi:MAG TPA: molybdenum cofactor guanylyltransferase [Bryobacterales bacterium]|nr:molybdenum cofactor guanylyltransferase [Bryobacterales bacterium]